MELEKKKKKFVGKPQQTSADEYEANFRNPNECTGFSDN